MVAIDGEDRGRLKALYLEMFAEYRPMGFEENLLVSEITETIWRKNRFKVAEAKAIDSYRYATFGGEERKGDVGLALAQDAGAYGTIPRCLAVEEILDRRLWRLLDRLRKLQKERGCYPCKSAGSSTGSVIRGTQPDESLESPDTTATSPLDILPSILDCDYPQI